MNILITGSSGFLGKHLVDELNKFNIVTLNRTEGNIKCDLASEIPKINSKFHIIIHNAGKAHLTPKTQQEKEQFFKVNVEGTKNLLEGIEKSKYVPKQFIFISSIAVYGIQTGLGITENFPLKAVDDYGLSKIQAEKIISNWCKKNNIICTILRLPLLVGPNPPGNLGAMIDGIKKGYYFNVAGGKAQKSMVLASDVAKSILKISEIGGIYNLTDGYHPTFNELSRTISLQFGKKFVLNLPLLFAKVLAKIGDLIGDKIPINSIKLSKIISPLTFDDSKVRKTFDWNPTPVLEGLKIIK